MRPEHSVIAHIWTQEKLLRDRWMGRVDGMEIEGSTRGPRGPKKRVGSSTKGETSSGVMLLQGRPLRWPSCQDGQWSNFKVTWQPGTYQVIVGKWPGTEVPPLDVTRYKGAADYIWLHWPLRMLANSRPRQDGHQIRWANNSQNEDAFDILANVVSPPDDPSVNVLTLLMLILSLVKFYFWEES